jgi:hypothetical protein
MHTVSSLTLITDRRSISEYNHERQLMMDRMTRSGMQVDMHHSTQGYIMNTHHRYYIDHPSHQEIQEAERAKFLASIRRKQTRSRF